MGIDELNLKALIRVFRRECHRVLDSERTTIHGADSMLMVLQLAAAEVHKQVTVQDITEHQLHLHYSNDTMSLTPALQQWPYHTDTLQ